MRLMRWRFASIVAAIVGLLLSSSVQYTAGDPGSGADVSDQAEFRTWSDRSGKFHAEAVLIDVTDGAVTIKKKDGATVKVSLKHLSDADRQYVEISATGAGGEDRTFPDSEPDESSDRPSGETAVGDDEGVRTEARGAAQVWPKARTTYRTTARTSARTTVESSGSQGTRRVTVDGVGATTEEALKDCFRKAVAVVMGSIVNTETQVENDRLVVDNILTLTDGFVDSFVEVGKAHVEDGLVHRRITATVSRDSLLVACGRAESASVDASGLYPEVMGKLERRRNAMTFLRKTLDMLPGSLLRVQVGRPRVEKLGDTRTALVVKMVICVDSQKYEAFQNRITKILQCLSRQDGTIETTSSLVDRISEPARQQLLRKKFLNTALPSPKDMCVVDVEFAGVEELSSRAITELMKGGPRPLEQKGGASLFIKRQSDWRWFDINEDVELSPMTATIAVSLCDSDGKEVDTTSLPLGPWVPCFATPSRYGAGVPRRAFFSPLFLYGDYSKVVVAESVTVCGGLTVENELLSRVHTIDANIRQAPSEQMETFVQEPKQNERGLRRNPVDPSKQAEELAKRALVAQRARAAHAAANIRIREHNAKKDAAFQAMWQQALRRSGR